MAADVQQSPELAALPKMLWVTVNTDVDFTHAFEAPANMRAMCLFVKGDLGGGVVTLKGGPNGNDFFLMPDIVICEEEGMESVETKSLACRFYQIELARAINPSLLIKVTMSVS